MNLCLCEQVPVTLFLAFHEAFLEVGLLQPKIEIINEVKAMVSDVSLVSR
jgi:hypothetical protein